MSIFKDNKAETEVKERPKREMNAFVALLLFILVCVAIGIQKAVFGGNMGAMFLMLWVIIIPIGMYYGFTSHEMEEAAIKFATKSLSPVFVLLTAGALIATWIAAGTTPAIIYYGIKLIHPSIFLVASMLLCSFVALLCGTSMGTVGTAGVALAGIGTSLGIPAPITAGAVICGAMFGDKMSPMSDTTILASSIAEVNIFKHIRHMTLDQIPTYIFSLIFFLVIGLKYNGQIDPAATAELMQGLQSNFKLGFAAFIPLLVTGVLLAKKQSALLSMLCGAVAGIVVSILYQGVPVADAFNIFYGGYSINSESEVMQTLFNRGGIADMWGLAGVTLFGFTVAGMLEHLQVIQKLGDAMVKKVHNPVGITALSILFGFIGNAIAFSQNFAIVMTGTLMRPVYTKFNMQPKNCSRDLEAGGTYGALLIPWNVNTVFMAAALGVSSVEFIPYIPLIYLTPIVVIIYAAFKFRLDKIYDDEGYVDVTERLANDPEKLKEVSGL
jgi:NhaC family Na+:H+ antiporter